MSNSPFRADGITYGTPIWIWSVVLESRLFVRAYNGTNSPWYRSAMAQGAGQISAATKESTRQYCGKYAGSPYLPPMLSHRTHEATVEVSPYADQ